MRFLVVDTYYPAFLASHYAGRPGLDAESYERQLRTLLDRCFGTSDFYSVNLAALGHEAREVVVNCSPLQRQWWREHMGGHRLPRGDKGRLAVLAAQVAEFRPDVVYVQDMTYFTPQALAVLSEGRRLLVGQTAYQLDWSWDFRPYDLVFTSFPHYVERFRTRGVAAEYLPIAFEPRVLERVDIPKRRDLGVVFIGGFSPTHRSGMATLEAVARAIPIDVWGYVDGPTDGFEALLSRFHGPAWGLEMYRVLARARIVVNRHAATAEAYANNMRLFESTGMGACLVTDAKANLGELFDVGEEVVAYASPQECIDALETLLADDAHRDAVATAGQARTLEEHTYARRMVRIAEVVSEPPARLHATASTVRRRAGLHARRVRSIARRVLGRQSGDGISEAYTVIDRAGLDETLTKGWKSPAIPARQRDLVDDQLAATRAGSPPDVFRIAADAVARCGLEAPTIAELGCASAYYRDVFDELLDGVDYVGVDYSEPLLRMAKERRADNRVVAGAATALPLRDGAVDIVFSSALLLHVPDYDAAIAEAARIAASHCVFHRTPTFEATSTTFLEKRAYGVPVVEVVFQETELHSTFARCGVEVVADLVIETYLLPGVREKVTMRTYVLTKR